MVDKKWEQFERLVTAIHMAQQQGATVKWNDTIKGRQFDVTIRFKNGFYDYLTVIECKDHKRAVSPEVVDALVTKSRDVGANKAIIVSASGYQEGSVKVARRHDIQLLTLKAINATTQEALNRQLTPMLMIYDFRLRQESRKRDIAFPEEPGVLRSLMRDTTITGPGICTVPEQIMNSQLEELRKTATLAPQIFQLEFPAGTTMTHPNTLHSDEVSSFLFQYCLVFPKDLDAVERLESLGLGSDPYLTSSTYRLKDEINETQLEIDVSRLDIGFDTVMQPGKYYANPHMEFSYYCEAVDHASVRMCLVESYQMGQLVQCEFTQDIQYSSQYVEITDAKEIERLSLMLKKFKRP